MWLYIHTNEYKEKYLAYNRLFKKTCKKAERKYYENTFDYMKNSIKSIWDKINVICSCTKKSKNSFLSINKLSLNNNIITAPDDIVNCLNNYFCNVANTVVQNITHSNHNYSSYLPSPLPNSCFCEPITNTEIIDTIHLLNKKKNLPGLMYLIQA